MRLRGFSKNLLVRTVGCALALTFALGGCSNYDPADNNANEVQSQLGQMHFYLETADDVVAFRFEVSLSDGTLVEVRTVALEDMDFPARLLNQEGVGASHRFADAYFMLEPGEYLAQAFPMKSEREESDVCDPSELTPVTVTAGRTIEIFLISQCEMPQNGGLDVVAVLNHEPVITNIEYEPSKFVRACEDACITVSAEDVDGDALTYGFALEQPRCPVCDPTEMEDPGPIADPKLTVNGNVVCLKSGKAGDYNIVATVTDSLGASTSMSFPVHVAGPEQGVVGFYYTVDGGDPICIDPWVGQESAVDFYQYGNPCGASANTGEGLEFEDKATFFVYQESQIRDSDSPYSLFMIFDIPGDEGGGSVEMDVDAEAGMTMLVGDEPTEPGSLDGNGDGHLSWTWLDCCTDGGVIGSFGENNCIDLTFTAVGAYDGETINGVNVVSGNGDGVNHYGTFGNYQFCLGTL